jgi:hypothetical protein
VRQRVDVEPARRHVGGHQQLGGAVAHSGHHPVALFLAHATVQCFGAIAAAVHRLGELIDLVAGAAEHDGGGGCFDVEDATECCGFVRTRHHVRGLADERCVAERFCCSP